MRQSPSLACPIPMATSPDGTPVRVEYRNPTAAGRFCIETLLANVCLSNSENFAESI